MRLEKGDIASGNTDSTPKAKNTPKKKAESRIPTSRSKNPFLTEDEPRTGTLPRQNPESTNSDATPQRKQPARRAPDSADSAELACIFDDDAFMGTITCDNTTNASTLESQETEVTKRQAMSSIENVTSGLFAAIGNIE